MRGTLENFNAVFFSYEIDYQAFPAKSTFALPEFFDQRLNMRLMIAVMV